MCPAPKTTISCRGTIGSMKTVRAPPHSDRTFLSSVTCHSSPRRENFSVRHRLSRMAFFASSSPTCSTGPPPIDPALSPCMFTAIFDPTPRGVGPSAWTMVSMAQGIPCAFHSLIFFSHIPMPPFPTRSSPARPP